MLASAQSLLGRRLAPSKALILEGDFAGSPNPPSCDPSKRVSPTRISRNHLLETAQKVEYPSNPGLSHFLDPTSQLSSAPASLCSGVLWPMLRDYPLPCFASGFLQEGIALPKNVEKLSFQARLNCLYRQSENFLTTSQVNIFPRLPNPIRQFAQSHFLLPPPRPLRPAQLGALQKMCEAPFPPPLGVFVSLVGGPPFFLILQSVPRHLRQNVPPQNVEKLSFCFFFNATTTTEKKYFRAQYCPILSRFQHFARFIC